MSYNQSRSGSDKSESRYRKPGRSVSSNQQGTSSLSYGKGGGGGGPPVPSPSSSSLSSNRSFNKRSSYVPQGGGQSSRVNVAPAVNSSDSGNNAASTNRNVQNGAATQPPLHGTSDAPPPASSVTKPTEASATPTSARAVPKAPTSQPATISSKSGASTTPAKAPADASQAFAFQFGSISPGFMNGMQVPARTSSAPPNLDEQKRDQARLNTFRPAPSLPTPAPKQQLPRKEASTADQAISGEVHLVPKAKKETQVSPAPSASQTQKSSVLPVPMTSMQMQYLQPQVSMQFGGRGPQIQTQGVPPTSHQMPIPVPLQMGSAPQVQQPVYIQHHPMQPQGMMRQGQNLSFTTTMGPQIPPQLGSLGMNIASQYSPQQGGKFGGQP
uniref:Uncharacterized protein n=1 Tax=Salix viminalis TaxID=40686 RepID=A0A6N2N9W8_SALVM